MENETEEVASLNFHDLHHPNVGREASKFNERRGRSLQQVNKNTKVEDEPPIHSSRTSLDYDLEGQGVKKGKLKKQRP